MTIEGQSYRPDCKCRMCEPPTPWRLWRALFAIAAALAACALLSLGCATVKADVKTFAEVCRPELLPDAAVALPLVVAVAMCEASGGTCEAQLQALAAAGKQDAAACANVMLHDATVKVAVITGTAK